MSIFDGAEDEGFNLGGIGGTTDASSSASSSSSASGSSGGSALALSKAMGKFGEGAQWGGMATSLDADAAMLGIASDSLLVESEYITKRMEEQGKKVSGAQMAAYGKSGVTFEGSPMLVYAESERNIRLDILTTRLNYVKEANNLGFKALNKKIAAGQARTRQVKAYGDGVVSMVTSLAKTGA